LTTLIANVEANLNKKHLEYQKQLNEVTLPALKLEMQKYTQRMIPSDETLKLKIVAEINNIRWNNSVMITQIDNIITMINQTFEQGKNFLGDSLLNINH